MPSATKLPVASGDDFDMFTNFQTQVRLDGDKVKALLEGLQIQGILTKEAVQGCYKEVSFNVVRLNRINKDDAPKFEMPTNLSNWTLPGILDEIGDVREQIKLLKKREGVFKEVLEHRMIEKGLMGTPTPKAEGEGGEGDEEESPE